MVWIVSVLYLVGTCAAFKVTAPASRLVAFRGQPAILGCEFTPDSNSDLSSLVVTWQRREDSRVVHSFYYQKDQLDRQSREYQNRTSLFMAELGKGNASLRIEPVGPEDKGQYLCMVSNTRGTDKALMQLEYGAFYTEPRLSLIFSCSNVTIRYEAEGFPEPEVRWFGDQGQNLSHHTELRTSPDEPAGLYHLRSSYVAQIPALNVTFTLTNQLLRQHLQRPVNITYGGICEEYGPNIPVIILSVLCLLLFVSCATFLFLILWKKTLLRSIFTYQSTSPEDHELQIQRHAG